MPNARFARRGVGSLSAPPAGGVTLEDSAALLTPGRAAIGRRTLEDRAALELARSVAVACHDMAVRFHRGGRLLVFGNGASVADAQHVAVEFVHPVIVGKRALPALSLSNDVVTMLGVAQRDP